MGCPLCGTTDILALYDDDYETAYRCAGCKHIWQEEKGGKP